MKNAKKQKNKKKKL